MARWPAHRAELMWMGRTLLRRKGLMSGVLQREAISWAPVILTVVVQSAASNSYALWVAAGRGKETERNKKGKGKKLERKGKGKRKERESKGKRKRKGRERTEKGTRTEREAKGNVKKREAVALVAAH